MLPIPVIFGFVKKFIFGGLLKYWKQFLIVAVIGYIYYIHKVTIPDYLSYINELEQANVACESSREELKGSIEIVNTQIGEWRDLSGKLQQQNDKLSTELIEMRKKKQKVITKILEGPTPKTCEEAIEYLKDVEALQKW